MRGAWYSRRVEADLDDDDGFEAHLRDLRAAHGGAVDRLLDAFDHSSAVLVTEKGPYGRDEIWILSLDTTPDAGRWRVSFLAEDGPRGHTLGETPEAIAEEYASPRHTYDPVDEDFVIAWTRTPQWEHGQKVVAFAQARNQLLWLAGKRGDEAYRWAIERLRSAEDLEDVDLATAVLEQLARDLEAGRAPNRTVEALRHRLLAP